MPWYVEVGRTPVNFVYGIFNSLFYCIDFFFFSQKKILFYKLFLWYTKHAFADIKTSTPWKSVHGTLLQKYFPTTKILHYFTVKQKIKPKNPSRIN